MAASPVSTQVKAPDIKAGRFHAYLIYDVADTIDLASLQGATGEEFQKAQLNLRAEASPSHIQFLVPPLVTRLPQRTVCGRNADVQIKLYDYGTVAVRLTFDYGGSFSGFNDLTTELRHSPELIKSAEAILAEVLKQAAPALRKAHKHLVEDYFIFEVESFEPPMTASDLLQNHRGDLTALMSSEKRHLAASEQDEALRVRFSYYENDLTVIQWDTAFVYDTRECAEAVESILEFANTQLVELRTYDGRLNEELDKIYKWNVVRSRPHWLRGRSEALQQTDRLRELLLDIRELTDRGNNALKIIGDAFYARLYRGAALRFGLPDWQQALESKLSSVSSVYMVATDEAQYARSEFMEVIIIVLISIEILMAIVGVGH